MKMTPEPGIKVVFFLLVTGAAKGLQIADIILTATSEGDDMVNGEVSFQVSSAAAFALVVIALKNIFPHHDWNANSGSFAHELCC